MVIKLKDFQANAASDMHRVLEVFLAKSDKERAAAEKVGIRKGSSTADARGNDPFRVQLVMPCGMGKTVTLAALLSGDRTLYARDPFAFKDIGIENYLTLFVTPGRGGLAEQAHASLKNQLAPYGRNVVLVNDSSELQNIGDLRGTVLVGAYESLVQTSRDTGEFKNTATKSGDKKNLWDILADAEASSVKVIFVVDEAHYATPKSAGAVRKFFGVVSEVLGYNPVRIEATATPLRKREVDAGRIQEVTQAEYAGVSEGMLRERLVLDHGAKLNYAKARRAVSLIPEFKDAQPEPVVFAEIMYRAWSAVSVKAEALPEDKKYAPLMLVAISDDSSNTKGGGSEELAQLVTYFEHKGIAKGTGLGIWLDGNEDTLSDEDKKNIAAKDSPIKVLIFKQAIALGWDCPRAQFLLMVRAASVASETFTPQLLGRIKRQPYGSSKGDELLDMGYVFTSRDRVSLAEYVAPNGVEGMDGGSSTFSAETSHIGLWNTVSVAKRNTSRANRNPAKPQEFMMALAGVPCSEELPGVAEYVATYHTDVPLEPGVKKLNGPKFTVAVSAPTNEKRLRNELEIALQPLFAEKGLRAVSKHAQSSIDGLTEWIHNSVVASGHTVEHKSLTYVLLLQLLRSGDTGAIQEALDACVNVAAKSEADHGGKWNVYTPTKCVKWVPNAHRGSKYAVDAVTRSPLDRTHVYGEASFEDGDAVNSEILFEQEVLEQLLSDDSAPDRQPLVSWMRNSNRIDGDSGAFSFTYDSAGDNAVTHQSFPDYATLLRREDGSLIPVMFEVKGENSGESGSGIAPTIAKASELRSLSDAATIIDVDVKGGKEHQNDTVGCVTYKNKGKWYAVTGGSADGTSYVEEPLVSWLKRYGIAL